MGYKPEYFKLEELVHPDYIERFGQRAWLFLQPAALRSLDQIRERFGPVTVNNWASGGTRKYSGLRPLFGGVGAQHSIHRFGGAFDCVFRDTSPIVVFDYILANRLEFPEITRLEDARHTRTWLHFDVAHTFSDSIEVFTP